MNPLEYALELAEKEAKQVKVKRAYYMSIVSHPNELQMEYLNEYEESLDKYNKKHRDAKAMVSKLKSLIEEGHE